jgi:Glycosyltransferase family 17
MKTYDCFTFFNELDVLEIRLQEMWDTADYFVIAESNLSHSGKSKDYILLDNWERFKPYADKIRHIDVNDMPNTQDSWVRERYQRWSLGKGLTDMAPEDLIIVSDLDEIPRAEVVEMIKTDDNDYDKYVLTIPMFQYKINNMKIFERSKQRNIMATRGRAFTDAQQERAFTFPWIPDAPNTVYIDHGGWHFTYFGDDKNAIVKLQNFAHTESDRPDLIARHNIEWMVNNKYGHHGPNHEERFEIVVVDDYFPKCIVDRIDYWTERNMIAPNAVFHVTDLYRENGE